MSQENKEKRQTSPLVYLLGIPLGILILVIAFYYWEQNRLFNECFEAIKEGNPTLSPGEKYGFLATRGCHLLFDK